MLESLKLGLYQTFILDDNYQYFIKGLGTTLTVTIFALVLGVILGVIVEMCIRDSPWSYPAAWNTPG